jgi:transcription-repair coupling factor (superfamily II helicase)
MSSTTPRPKAVTRLAAARELQSVTDQSASARTLSVYGLWGSSLAAVTAALESRLQRPILVICGHVDEADDIADDMELFHGRRPEVLSPLEIGSTLGKFSEEQVAQRIQLLAKMLRPAEQPRLVVAPVQSIMQAVPSPKQLAHMQLTLRPGLSMEPEKLIVWLSEHGYNRLDQVEVPGDFAVRGGIIDIYLPGEFQQAGDQIGLTARLDFFGDEIESIKHFSLDTLGSLDPITEVTLSDLKGALPNVSEATNFINYMPEDSMMIFWAPLEISEQARSFLDRLRDPAGIYPLPAILKIASRFKCVEVSQFDQGGNIASVLSEPDRRVSLPVRSLQKFETDARKAVGELAELTKTHTVCIFCENTGESQRFAEMLEQHQQGLSKDVEIAIGYLHRGFVWEEEGETPIALLGHHELFNRYHVRRRLKRVIESRPVDSFLDLKAGDYVVHVAHGIARFMGIKNVNRDGRSEEMLVLRFADNASLHVPVNRVNLIQKYIGGFHGHPQLSRLGSGTWEKQKEKVAEAVMDLAAELLEVQAARAAQQGVAYPPDTQWQQEFEAEFPYTPTPDQVTAAVEIKSDMQKPRPMDRLLCGDVGYGKTEMAMRAAFKAVEHGKQVAVLVPTTVLAEQHFRSFRDRMVNYPFRVESISRFKTAQQQKKITKDLTIGTVDVLIGTHRLLSKDVKFADLGLVIIDEEQRFGVGHKERLKQLRAMVDVLTMSATPIPRTLHMSLLGIRDISSLTTAPQDRRSIVTEIMPFDKERIKSAVERELAREGQVYFVHNRVSNIHSVADEIQQLVPDARIIIGHGQMAEGALEKVMLSFVRHEADILVCTTIIESGLDIPNVNTIFINQADRFGLSELHQLRGRVGRYKHRAYCYLLLPPDRPITPIAAKRLKAIEEFSHLGSGFKIAMRDLEIRGTGNILGPEQSGHIATVGYEMYCQLLEEATRELKNEPKPARPEAHIEIGLSASIPRTYMDNDAQRLDVYRRISRCGDLETIAQLQKDIADAYGDPPRQVIILFAMTELRLLAGHFGIESIIKQDPDVVLRVRDAAAAQQGLAGAPGTLRVVDETTVYFRPPKNYLEPETLLMALWNLMKSAYARRQAAAAPTPTAPSPAVAPPPAPKPLPAETAEPKPAPQPTKAKPAQPTPAQQVQLEKLKSLRDHGVLTEEEYHNARKRLLGS